MQVAIGALMGILAVIGLGKSVYDRYFKRRMKARPTSETTTPEVEVVDNPLTHDDWQVRLDAVQSLNPTADDIERLTPLLDDDDYDVRIASRDALVQIGEPTLQTLLTILQSGSPDARQHAAEAIGAIGDKSSIHLLIEALEDESKWVRLAVVGALGHFSTQSARKALAHIRDTSEDVQLREAAQQALEN